MDKGAHFFRCDFQVHTPRDTNWTGDRAPDDQERERYAAELVAACRKRGLNAIAITDHHDMSFYPFVRVAAERESDGDGNPIPSDDRLVVFPGMELTLAVPCQALLILDADLPLDRLSLVPEALAIPVIPIDDPLPPVERLDIHTFGDLCKELDKRDWLRGRYIVLPNVSESGSSTMLRSGYAPKYKEMPCVGAYVDGLVTQWGNGNRNILAGKNKQYGNKKVAVFQTSDNRRRDHRDLGTKSSWIKWSTPTAEALRQACLADATRLSHTQPSIPASYISELRVSNSSFLGPLGLELNSQYNAVIGGRGTGKSTLLEYLRWALCDQPVRPGPEEDLTDQALRRDRLVRATLAEIPNAEVEVRFVVNDLPHVVRRVASTGEIHLKVGERAFRQVSEGDVRAVMPIQAFSQKQLSSVSVRVDELTRFVTAPVQSRLLDIESELASLASQIRESYARLQRQRQLEALIRREELALESLREQASKLREGLTGVGPDDQLLLNQREQYESAREHLDALDRAVARGLDGSQSFRDLLARLRDDLQDERPDDLPHARALLDMRASVESAIGKAIAAAESASAALEGVTESARYKKAHDAWSEGVSAFEAQYEAATRRWTEHEQRLRELGEVEKRQRAQAESVAAARGQLRDLVDPVTEYAGLRDRWLALLGEHMTLIGDQCEELTDLSGGAIQASVRIGSAVPEMAEALKRAVSGANVRGTRIDSAMDALGRRPEPLKLWESVLAELELLARHDPDDSLAGPIPDTPTLTGLGLARADLERVANRLTPDSWLDLALTQFSDKPTFGFRSAEDRYIPFENASAGQQATALLDVLLQQSGPPLLIDQPEDDLDSEVVLEVAERIGDAKARRQLILASHDANLVVNGDADLVICCQYRVAGDHSGGKIGLEGAIDVPDMRILITTVMEGGEKAFRLRTAKYGF